MQIAQEALTFDDVLLLPAHSIVLPRDVSLSSQLTRDIELKIPLLSAAMDTVTEARLAITLAQEGGIGVIAANSIGMLDPEYYAKNKDPALFITSIYYQYILYVKVWMFYQSEI